MREIDISPSSRSNRGIVVFIECHQTEYRFAEIDIDLYANVKELVLRVDGMFARVENQATTMLPFEPAEESDDQTPPIDDEHMCEDAIGSDGERGDMRREVQPKVILLYRTFKIGLERS